MVGCALAFGLASLRATGGEEVLSVARAVPAGQVLQAGDLRVVRFWPTAGVQPVPAHRAVLTVLALVLAQ